jgi:GH18 family chitinase
VSACQPLSPRRTVRGLTPLPSTNHIIRNGVKPENRDTFAANIVNFVHDNNLDGVDFDWEYPGATDIDGSEPGTPDDGPNYLEFLKILRDTLGKGKTLSFAAPASFWYLKSFPIKEMAQVVDYIVYMTYDLHGQWDVGNKWAV